MSGDAFNPDLALSSLQEAELQIRYVLEQMAVVPNVHRTRLSVALRLIEDARRAIAPGAAKR